MAGCGGCRRTIIVPRGGSSPFPSPCAGCKATDGAQAQPAAAPTTPPPAAAQDAAASQPGKED